MLLLFAWWTGVRVLFAIVAFAGVLHLLRDVTRPLITRFIPVQTRMQSGFFKLQSRLTIGVNILLALLAALGTNILILRVQQWTSSEPAAASKVERFQLFPVLPSEESKVYEELPETPEADASQSAPEEDSPREAPSVPSEYEMEVSSPTLSPHYLQIGAFLSEKGASDWWQAWKARIPYPLEVVFFPQEYAPYKVLVGPFSNEAAAQSYKAQLQTDSFYRSVHLE